MREKNNNKIFILLTLLVLGWLLYQIGHILTPFLVGALLAYLFNPLVTSLKNRFNIPRVLSVTLVFCMIVLVLLLLIFLLIPVIDRQIQTLLTVIPNFLTWVQDKIIPWLQDNFGIAEEGINVEDLKQGLAVNIKTAGSAASTVAHVVLFSSIKIIEWIVGLILIPVVMFYLLCDWNKFITGIHNLLPRNIEPTVVKLAKQCDDVLGAFFRGQLMVMLVLGIIYSVCLTLMGLQVGIIVGIISGLLSIVPYLGFSVGVIIASIAAFVQNGTLSSVIIVILIYMGAHVVEHFILAPKLVGNRIGLHPVAVIFAILAGGALFGFVGILLALPVAAVIRVLMTYAHHRYRQSDLYQS